MSTTTEELADLEAISQAFAAKQPLDPQVVKRVRQRAEAVKEALRRQGLTDLAVPLIREAREE